MYAVAFDLTVFRTEANGPAIEDEEAAPPAKTDEPHNKAFELLKAKNG